jgi:hypothetical protein
MNIATATLPAARPFPTMEMKAARRIAFFLPHLSGNQKHEMHPKSPPTEKRPFMAPKRSGVFGFVSSPMYDKKEGCPRVVAMILEP